MWRKGVLEKLKQGDKFRYNDSWSYDYYTPLQVLEEDNKVEVLSDWSLYSNMWNLDRLIEQFGDSIYVFI